MSQSFKKLLQAWKGTDERRLDVLKLRPRRPSHGTENLLRLKKKKETIGDRQKKFIFLTVPFNLRLF